ncbi:hypothetical protein [Trinickia sp.]|uniref:hypothetical protein n=1 Tax=Trinickia sp. TaxID=2571163 RepID=UPI003F815891
MTDAVSPGDWTLVDTRGRAHTIDGPCRLVSNNMQMLVAAAPAGSGIAYGPSFAFGDTLSRGELATVLPRYRTAEFDLQAGVSQHAAHSRARAPLRRMPGRDVRRRSAPESPRADRK